MKALHPKPCDPKEMDDMDMVTAMDVDVTHRI